MSERGGVVGTARTPGCGLGGQPAALRGRKCCRTTPRRGPGLADLVAALLNLVVALHVAHALFGQLLLGLPHLLAQPRPGLLAFAAMLHMQLGATLGDGGEGAGR